MKIRVGNIIKTENDEFTVKGSVSFRGVYKYHCLDKTGKKVTIARKDLLSSIEEGSCKIF